MRFGPLCPILQGECSREGVVELSDARDGATGRAIDELLLRLIPQLDKFPRVRRFTLGAHAVDHGERFAAGRTKRQVS